MANHIQVGKALTIKAGTRVTRAGSTTKRKLDSTVTVQRVEPTKNGKVRVYWKSHGYTASTLV